MEKKLDLACGQHPREGFEGVDLYAPQAAHKVDLLKFPWPWENDSVDELHCSHYIEHIACREVEERDVYQLGDLLAGKQTIDASSWLPSSYVGQDMMFAFFDEAWRVLKDGGKMTVIAPCGRSNRAFQDPTHRRFIVGETFCYFNEPWRKAQGLDHYRARCNFDFNVGTSFDQAMTLHHQEVQNRRFHHEWNTIIDWHVSMVARKSKA